ncbi:unnamed protein product, partial [Musa hybrid cultivar]
LSRALLSALLLLSWRSRLSAKVGAALRRKDKASNDRRLGYFELCCCSHLSRVSASTCCSLNQ